MDAANRSPLCPTLIGRTTELTALNSLVEQTRGGQGGVALIAGEAGIGKSRLVSELKILATYRHFLVAQGACFPADRSCPYALLLELVRSLFATNARKHLIADSHTLASVLFPLLPDLIPRPDDRQFPLPPLDPEQSKRRLEALLTQFLLHQTAHTPVLLIVEDLHWCDANSLDFLHYLARRITTYPLLLLGTYRHDEVRPELRNWLTQIDRARLSQEFRLVPLARAEIDTMLSTIFEERQTAFDMRRFLHGDLLTSLYTLTEGNPFFVEETLSSLISGGDIFYAQGYWNHRVSSKLSIPRSVQDAVQNRTAHLNKTARQVLTLAAVAGRRFDFALLQQLTHYDEYHLLLIMKELVSAQFVVEESADQFAFRHALTRQAIYTQLLTRERRILHRTIAEMLEEQSLSASKGYLERLAYHFYRARVWHKVAQYAQSAGEKALGLHAHRAAIEYFTWVLEALKHLSLSATPAHYRGRGHAYETIGEFEQAQRDYTSALDAAHAVNDRTAEWQSMLDLGFLWAGRDYLQTERWFRQALTLAKTLNDPLMHARTLNRIGNWHLNAEQPHEALHSHREALTLFEHGQDTHGIAETLDLLGMGSYLAGNLSQGTTYYHKAIALFYKLDNKQGLTSSLATLTLRGPTYQTDMLVSAANLTTVTQDAENALRVAREIGHRSGEVYALFQLALALGSQGEYGRALTTARQSMSVAEEIEHRQWQTATYTVLGGIYTGLLAHTQARAHFEQALVLARETGSLFWTRIATGYLASVAVQQHELDLAETVLESTLVHGTANTTMAQRLIWCAYIELAIAQRKPERGLKIIEQWLASEAEQNNGQHSLRTMKLYGELLLELQRFDEAESALGDACTLASTLGVHPVHWRLCRTLGKVYQSQGKNAEAEQIFTTARTVIEKLAASLSDETLRTHFLQLATAQVPRSRSSSATLKTKQHAGGLTAREREVAILIAQGKPNQAIAETMVVTKLTVETHIGNIMFKLGYSSRTQIAVWAIETGLVSKPESDESST